MYFNYYKFRAKLNKTAILAQFGDKVTKKNANMQKKSNQEKKRDSRRIYKYKKSLIYH